ncbi:MAG: copper homeostasis protein CutC [Dysgonamonadaceae bacterium]|jgi:copper homeostasis protein|nr:copper homeostasis protein CutC [Dysgonamonadaceae bacterium]
MIIEVCTDSVASSCIAQTAGAHRIELCGSLSEGGITPSPSLISETRKAVTLQVYVLIRPRGGDFLYSASEFDIIRSDIHFCGQAGCDGVVIGLLRPDGTVDKDRCRELVEIARRYSMGVTFHRAFDRSRDLFQALEDVIDLGCERILTSGGYPTALEGAQTLRQLIEQANDRIIVMPGAGITPENAGDLIRITGLKEIHGSFRTLYSSKMLYRNPLLSNWESEYTIGYADAEKIENILHLGL